MKAEDRYLKFVKWEEEAHVYAGYCPDLFPWGGVCHGPSEEDTCHELCLLVRGEVGDLLKAGGELPPSQTRPMREAIAA